MTEENGAKWHDEPTDYGQIGKLPRFEAASANDDKASMVSSSLSITAAATEPELLDLPWHIALEDWPADPLVALPQGISRHLVRFVRLGEDVYRRQGDHRADGRARIQPAAHPGTPGNPMRGTDRRGDRSASPPTAEPLESVLITKHLQFSLPYRALFSHTLRPETMSRLPRCPGRRCWSGCTWPASSGATCRCPTPCSAATPGRSPPMWSMPRPVPGIPSCPTASASS